MIEARSFSGLAVDTWLNLRRTPIGFDTLRRGDRASRSRLWSPGESLDLHLSADAITKRLSDMTDAELAPSNNE